MEKAITKAAQAQLENQNQDKKRLQDLIRSMEGQIAKALPSVITPERFTRMVLSAISANEKLATCTQNSFLGAMMNAAQLGLEPNTPLGQAYIIPYWNSKKNVTEAQFQIGYKGLIDLAYRSGQVSIVDAQIVYENDEFEYELGIEPKLRHKPALHDRGNAILVYGMFRTKDGGFGFQVMSMDDIRKFAQKYSKSYNSGPWQTNFEEMAKKTVLKKTLKYAPMKSDFLQNLSQDESIKSELSPNMYDVPNEISYVDAEVLDVDQETGEIIGIAKESSHE